MKKKNMTKLLGLLVLVLIILTSCDPAKKWEKEERQMIQDYLNSVGDTNYVLKPSGLYYYEVLAGTGRMPVTNDTVYFRYTGLFLDGFIFDSNLDKSLPDYFVVGSGNVIAGMDEGVRYMKDGGKANLLLPSKLAYGSFGNGPISGYTPLLFRIQLVGVKAGEKK